MRYALDLFWRAWGGSALLLLIQLTGGGGGGQRKKLGRVGWFLLLLWVFWVFSVCSPHPPCLQDSDVPFFVRIHFRALSARLPLSASTLSQCFMHENGPRRCTSLLRRNRAMGLPGKLGQAGGVKPQQPQPCSGRHGGSRFLACSADNPASASQLALSATKQYGGRVASTCVSRVDTAEPSQVWSDHRRTSECRKG